MSRIIVADTSCLIGLDNIGKLDILSELYLKIFIPPAVRTEFGKEIFLAEIIAPKDQNLVSSLELLLGLGESEAIALALEYQTPIILDDKQARTVAEKLGLHITGTVGILTEARRKNIISSLKDSLNELEEYGFYLNSAMKERALKLAGEKS